MSAVSTPPLSWLVLEQYALGELDDAQRAHVEAQLARSDADRAALQSILDDAGDLPVLWPHGPSAPDRSAKPAAPIPRTSAARRWAWRTGGGALAAAAALVLLLKSGLDTRGELPPARRNYKGGELALRVVSERGGDAQVFHAGERLKLFVTCPPGQAEPLRAVVFQAGNRYTPLPDAAAVACGNGVPWPGALTLDGADPVDICVGEARAVTGARSASDLVGHGVCVRLPAAGM